LTNRLTSERGAERWRHVNFKCHGNVSGLCVHAPAADLAGLYEAAR
jgi:hypothetical protein